MTESSDWLSLALADRYRLERELGTGGMATVLRPELAAVIGPEPFLEVLPTTLAWIR